MSDTQTPRTDAIYFPSLDGDWHKTAEAHRENARQLERELAAERAKTELLANQLQASAYRDKDILELQQRAEQAEARLAEINGIVDFRFCTCDGEFSENHHYAGCPYALIKFYLASTEPPALEVKLNIAREALNEIRSKTTQAGYDSGDSGVCAIAEAAISKI